MTANDLLQTLRDHGIAIRADGHRLRLSPAEAVPVELVEELRRRKPEILAGLSEWKSAPVTVDDRRASLEQAVEDANRYYRGGPINWPAVDSAADRIQTAGTLGDLDAAVRLYVAAACDETF